MKVTLISEITVLLAVISTGIAYRHEHTPEMHAIKARQYASDISSIGAELKKITNIQPDARDDILRDLEKCKREELSEPSGCSAIVSAPQGRTLADKRRHEECTDAINVFIDETQARQQVEVACKQQVIRQNRRQSDRSSKNDQSRDDNPDDGDRSSKNGLRRGSGRDQRGSSGSRNRDRSSRNDQSRNDNLDDGDRSSENGLRRSSGRDQRGSSGSRNRDRSSRNDQSRNDNLDDGDRSSENGLRRSSGRDQRGSSGSRNRDRSSRNDQNQLSI